MEKVRISKLMSEQGLCSRREADRWVDAGRVTINGVTAKPGDQVSEGATVAVDGKPMAGPALLKQLNEAFGAYGVGRNIYTGDTTIGLKGRIVFECPGLSALMTAHRALEALVSTQGELKFKKMVDTEWGELAYKGLWYDPLKEDLEAFINKIQERVTGTVTLRLAKGSAIVVGRDSKNALYNEDLASFDSKTFDQTDSTGMVKMHGLQGRMYWLLKNSK